jgi:integrase
MLSLGVYPDVSLLKARTRRDEERRLIADRIDPSLKRRATRSERGNTLQAIGEEWLQLKSHKLADVTIAKSRWLLTTYILPRLGNRPINKITAPELLAVLKRIESENKHETAHRAKQKCGEIFRYAIATGRAERDIAADLRGALGPVAVKNHAAITEPARVGELLRAIDGYIGQPTTFYAMELAPLLFVRPRELRQAQWSEFDLTAAEWRIPAARMKMNEQHIVPLSSQSLALLQMLLGLTGSGRFVFPSLRSSERPMSENTVTAALRRMGYAGHEMTWHGFRTIASTLLNELGWNPDLIELQLAHKERNKVRAAYNKAQRLTERRKMMQAWADHLDDLRGAKITTLISLRVPLPTSANRAEK